MYLCVEGIDFTSYYDFVIGIGNFGTLGIYLNINLHFQSVAQNSKLILTMVSRTSLRVD